MCGLNRKLGKRRLCVCLFKNKKKTFKNFFLKIDILRRWIWTVSVVESVMLMKCRCASIASSIVIKIAGGKGERFGRFKKGG